jgi:hypothetical protein
MRLALLMGAVVLGCADGARAQFGDVVIDPALGPRPIFGPGGFISNGNGYGAYGPRGYGYYTGLYFPPNDLGNGPSPYYSPIYNAMAVMRPADVPYPGGERAGWALRPSLPFTGRRVPLFHRR